MNEKQKKKKRENKKNHWLNVTCQQITKFIARKIKKKSLKYKFLFFYFPVLFSNQKK